MGSQYAENAVPGFKDHPCGQHFFFSADDEIISFLQVDASPYALPSVEDGGVESTWIVTGFQRGWIFEYQDAISDLRHLKTVVFFEIHYASLDG